MSKRNNQPSNSDRKEESKPVVDAKVASNNSAAIRKLIGFSVMIFILPISTFFLCTNYLFNSVNAESNLLYSSIAAVIIVNIILFLFIVMALREESKGGEKEKKA